MSKHEMQTLWATGHLAGSNMAYIDGLYEDYLQNPDSIPQQWRNYFDDLPQVDGVAHEISHQIIKENFIKIARQHPVVSAGPRDIPQELKQAHVLQLINAYRLFGHLEANLDPLGMTPRKEILDLKLENYRLSDADQNTLFITESPLMKGQARLADIVAALRETYCKHIGVEYLYTADHDQIQWLKQRIESSHAKVNLTAEQKRQILVDLTAAEGLEKYLGSKYVGQKRFSLEGGDSLIPMLRELVAYSGSTGVKELVMGMAHRGRLNVLVNVLGKEPEELFQEFEGAKKNSHNSGDVKYHMGFSSDVKVEQGLMHLVLAFNPSHLEIISPVVEGAARARQRNRNDLTEHKEVVPIVIHGDAAFAGQGVVMETFSLSQARGYTTGGTIHIVINNQIGFTTSCMEDARSTEYCTDIAKMVNAPVFHVNADDPEAAIFVTRLAFDYRMKFKRDVVIDLFCYRRHGHNEADEPSVTQPKMYETIKQLETVRQKYAKQLVADNILTAQQADALVLAYRDTLDKGEAVVKTYQGDNSERYEADWTPFIGHKWDEPAVTAVPKEKLVELAKKLMVVPENFTLHPVIKRLFDERTKMTEGELPLNWGYAETLAYATLLVEGHLVRLSGQDSGRGTFAHRHAVLHDYETNEIYIPLQHLSDKQQTFEVIDSVLSEEAVVGFEYGYSAAEPDALVLWEAQFGDFANGAQVVIDQFISSGEQKWGRLCGLVMLLPHGFEGQGPEHSSARLERYMQLCAQHNIQVCVPTTPAQIFHVLRRQMIRPFRKPLIVLTPKSLLRHKLAVSSLTDLTAGKFQLVIPEIDQHDPQQISRIVMCSGKVYYDLLQYRRDHNIQDVVIIRIEQLYPFPKKELRKILELYEQVTDIVWCQEEPKNQGAWFSSQHNMKTCLKPQQVLNYVGRGFCASPAAGSLYLHVEQQTKLIEEALGKKN